MVNMLQEELGRAGPEMNSSKTRILTTDCEFYTWPGPYMAQTGEDFLDVARQKDMHKYLGKVLTGDPGKRGQRNLTHRLSVAWMKFHSHRCTLLNRKIPINLRLQMFNAIVPPAALYSLTSTPLTSRCMERLDVAQRKMLRSIVGWPRTSTEDWAERGRQMKDKMEKVLEKFPVQAWSAILETRKQELAQDLSSSLRSVWANAAHKWRPDLEENLTSNGAVGKRMRGRPPQRWHDRTH